MKKKFICTVCGYVHEGDQAPERCPQCGVPASKFKEIVDNGEALQFITEHHIGDGVVEDAEVMEGLKAHFMGECTEVGMYLAMSRQADREGYPEIAEAFLKPAKTQNAVRALTRCVLPNEPKNSVMMLFMIPYMKWQRTKPVMVKALKVSTTVISKNNLNFFL